MSGIGTVWGIAKIAATRIPWGTVMENVPALVDMVGRAKWRLKHPGAGQHDLQERLRALEEENLKLGKALLETTNQLQELARSIEVVAARQKMFGVLSIVSLLAAIGSLLLWL